jgi:hypothetical protein
MTNSFSRIFELHPQILWPMFRWELSVLYCVADKWATAIKNTGNIETATQCHRITQHIHGTIQQSRQMSITGALQQSFNASKMWGYHGGDHEECRRLGYKNPVRTPQEKRYVSATESSRLIQCKIWGFMAVTVKNAVFWDVTQCKSCKNRRFGVNTSPPSWEWKESAFYLFILPLIFY